MRVRGVVFCFLVAFGLADISCQKTLSGPPAPVVDSTKIFGFRDSTLLIKSISYVAGDSSSTEYYFYDTVNKKIIVSLQPVLTATQDYSDGEEFDYDANGLLIHTQEKFADPDGHYFNFSSADYQYDQNQVLKSSTITLFGGQVISNDYTKTPVSEGGYILSTLYTNPGNSGFTDSNYDAVYIDGDGKYISHRNVRNTSTLGDIYNTNPSGDTYFYTSDTAIYDAVGNLSKWYYTYYPDPLKPDSLVTILQHDYVSRETRGDQLYDLGRVLYNGVANFTSYQVVDDFIGRLSPYGPDGAQFYKYPAVETTSMVSDSLGIYHLVDFNSPVQFESQSRLTGYHYYFDYSYPVSEYDLRITYYK